MIFSLRTVTLWLGLYFVGLVYSFVSEVKYKKMSIYDVRKDWKRITIRTSIIFTVICTYFWGLMGLKGQ